MPNCFIATFPKKKKINTKCFTAVCKAKTKIKFDFKKCIYWVARINLRTAATITLIVINTKIFMYNTNFLLTYNVMKFRNKTIIIQIT